MTARVLAAALSAALAFAPPAQAAGFARAPLSSGRLIPVVALPAAPVLPALASPVVPASALASGPGAAALALPAASGPAGLVPPARIPGASVPAAPSHQHAPGHVDNRAAPAGGRAWDGASPAQARGFERRFGELEAAFGERRGGDAVRGDAAAGAARLPPASSAGTPAAAPPDAPPPQKPRSDLPKRAATAAVLVPALIGLAYAGGPAFSLLVAALSGGMLWEYTGILRAGGRQADHALTLGAGLALTAAVIAGSPLSLALAGVGAAVALRELLSGTPSLPRAAATLAGAVVLGALPAHLALLRALPAGRALVLLAFASAWATDTLAYLVGRRFGKRKLAPTISPKKTWEGSAGGLAGALLTGAAFAGSGALPWAAALSIAATIGTLGQASGLASSMVKRAHGVKDSGSLLPGHGGVLDRFDTFVLTAGAVYALALLLL